MRERSTTNHDERLSPTALAQLLEAQKEPLLQKWSARVLLDPGVPSAVPLSELALHDHFPAIIDRIVATLRSRSLGGEGEGAEQLGAALGTAIEARDHLRDRVQADYKVPEVLRELSHLRIAIVDLCEEAGSHLDHASSAILHAAFDHMMIHAADELARLELAVRRRAEALAGERTALYEKEKEGRRALEEAHRAKDQFLAMISHELRTPLNAISGWSQMLARSDENRAMRARAIASIQRNAKAQGHLIDGVLDITRLTSGRVDMERAPIDLPHLLRTIVESFTPALGEKGLRLEVAVPEVAPAVLGDEQRVRQVFTNLIANAVKFTPAGGALRVSLRSDRDALRAEVTDSGIGIEPGFLPHVFEPFRQADVSWTREHGGLGLGLAISKALVELHGGTIDVASPGKGKGATFVVTLPVAASDRDSLAPLALAPAPADKPLTGLRVLVVDDAPDSRDLLAAMLEGAGATVDTASAGPEGLRAAAATPPDVVVSDLAMPGMDGLELLAQLRARIGYVPAIALSAFTAPRAIADAKAAGFDGYVAKPVVMTELLEAVGSVADRREAPSARSVLVVEDDRAIADELREILSDRGFAVRVAPHGAEAWSLLQEGAYRPSVIVMDMMMPEMDGWTLRKKLLTEDRLASIPVVVVTGAQRQEVSDLEGVAAILHKPFDLRSLLDAIPAGVRRGARGPDAE